MIQNQDLKLTTVLFRAFNHIQDIIKKDITNYQLNVAEFGTLEILYHKGKLPIQDICHKMLMPNSSMTYVVNQLTIKGYILKEQDLNDKRQTLVSLSIKGMTFFKQIFDKHQKTLHKIYDILKPEEKDMLIILLKNVGYHAKAIGESI